MSMSFNGDDMIQEHVRDRALCSSTSTIVKEAKKPAYLILVQVVW